MVTNPPAGTCKVAPLKTEIEPPRLLPAVVVVPLLISNAAVNVNAPPISSDDIACIRIIPPNALVTVPLLLKPTPFKVNVLPPITNMPPVLMMKFVAVVLPLPKVKLLVKVVVEPPKIVMLLLVNEPVPDRF